LAILEISGTNGAYRGHRTAGTRNRETELYHESVRLMPALPFDDIDLLIVDRIGKNISGSEWIRT